MKKLKIKRLDWDSAFFGFEVGEGELSTDYSEASNFDLLVIKQKKEEDIFLFEFEKMFQETKIIYEKKLTSVELDPFYDSIKDFDEEVIDKSELYLLAFESGRYSRFKLDPKIPQEKFELLYSKWVDNSVDKKIADKLFYIRNSQEVIGFVTLKNNDFFSTIGLIAVSKNYQGKGLGKGLLLKAENYCITQNIFNLKIPTQKENILACHFYEKMGYAVNDEVIIKHYWKKNL